MRIGVILAALVTLAAPATARNVPPEWRVERAVIVMRHGVRPPTKDPALPAGFAIQRWPVWPVAPGWLTPHGAAAVRLLAADDRAWLVVDKLMPTERCPRSSDIRLVADSDERTIATAEAYRDVLFAGCTITIEHRPQGERDPLFSPDAAEAPLAADTALAAARGAAGAGGIAAVEASARPELRRLDAILCGPATADCGVSRHPTTLVIGAEGRPKFTGALDRGSTGAQVLLLEYAEGKPAGDVGWGRATAADITLLSRLHALEFALLARPLPLARRNMAGLAPLIRGALLDEKGPAVTVITGHDTNVASLAGLLDLHWTIPGFATDDPSPGGAVILERLVDRQGRRVVRISYRSQTLDEIRSLSTGKPVRTILGIGRCGMARTCPLTRVAALLE